jgi:tetratricopeptide (TPR) repeat protein
MFVTFYSYKGGVGRTLALANVAYCLATDRHEPCKVLLWDFDLEAPGLQQVLHCKWGQKKLGFIDLVFHFIKTHEVPSIADYIHHTDVPGVDILPAGLMNRSYSAKFAQLNWRDLYHQLQGFTFVEKVKMQLSAHKPQYDYILIDSRTGYSDVSGICTLQLPDIVVLVFRLNDQNLGGISKVNKIIQAHSGEKRHRRIDVIPVVSPAWPFGAMDANKQLKKAARIFGDLDLLRISFDPALNYKEKILLKEKEKYDNPPICADYVGLTSKIRSLNQDDPLTILEGGKERMENIDFDGAFSKFKRLVQLQPSNSDYWTYLADAAISSAEFSSKDEEAGGREKLKEAEELIDEQVEANPKNAGLLLAKAKLLSQRDKGDLLEVESVLSKALDIDPKLVQAYIMRGMRYVRGKQYEKAIADFTRITELDAKDAQAHLHRGKCFRELDRYAEAEKDFKRAIDLNNREPIFYLERARLFFEQEKYDKAESDIKALLSIAPRMEHAKVFYCHVLASKGKQEEALTILNELEKGHPLLDTRLNIAETYIALGAPQKALAILPKKELPLKHRLKIIPEIFKAIAEVILSDEVTAITREKVANLVHSIKESKPSWNWAELRQYIKRASRDRTLTPEKVALIEELVGR